MILISLIVFYLRIQLISLLLSRHQYTTLKGLAIYQPSFSFSRSELNIKPSILHKRKTVYFHIFNCRYSMMQMVILMWMHTFHFNVLTITILAFLSWMKCMYHPNVSSYMLCHLYNASLREQVHDALLHTRLVSKYSFQDCSSEMIVNKERWYHQFRFEQKWCLM